MLDSSEAEHFPSILPGNEEEKKNVMNIVTFLNKSKLLFQEDFFNCPANNEVIIQSLSDTVEEKLQARSIYVCTFCQVFSPSDSAIAAHIATVHGTSLPSGTKAENFVSRLQALQNENVKKSLKKGGRPRKKESLPVVEEKKCEPVPGPDGLYWCWNCRRHFKKARQLSQHICLEISGENDFSNESAADSDSTSDFRTHMDVEPSPWFRRPRHTNNSIKKKSEDGSSLLSKEASTETTQLEDLPGKTKLFWRDDPNYVHLFEDDSERLAFEEHLKSIEYDCVDNLFVKVENKTKRSKKKNMLPSVSIYSCILCQKELNSITHIRMHCLTHTDVKPFTCPKCPYRSNTKGSLYTHMRNHTGKLFKCSKCDFRSIKRSHLLEHEQTHASVSQLCKLCKNSYKTVKSLIAHVRRYHNYPGGIKYAKSLSAKPSKDSYIRCNICQKRFKSQVTFVAHSHPVVTDTASAENMLQTSSPGTERLVLTGNPNDNLQNIPARTEQSVSTENPNESLQDIPPGNKQLNQLQLLPISDSAVIQNEIMTLKDPLAEIVLNDLLQQKNTESIEMFEDVFQQCANSKLLPHLLTTAESLSNSFAAESSASPLPPLSGTNQFQSAKTVLEECEKTLNLDMLNECLTNSSFANEVIAENCGQAPKLSNDCSSFGLPQMQLTYSSESLMSSNITGNEGLSKGLTRLDTELDDKNDLNEPKSAEVKLFEKCRRAPAYVCCVCSGIFICTSTLKAHLKEHVNTSNTFIEQDDEDFEQPKMSETDAAIDNVCKILQDPADSCFDNEKELEKLYSSSMKMYFPEVSVLLENDPDVLAIIDEIANCDDMF